MSKQFSLIVGGGMGEVFSLHPGVFLLCSRLCGIRNGTGYTSHRVTDNPINIKYFSPRTQS